LLRDALMRLIASEETFQKCALAFPNGAWELTFPFKQRQLSVRPLLPGESLQPIFRLIFDIYIKEQGLIAPDTLPPPCREASAKWDEWDLLPTTHHYVAFDGEELIGHSRIVNESAIGLPIERNGFDLSGERASGYPLSEVSKTVIRPAYRASALLSALLWQVFHQARRVELRRRILLTCDPSFTKVYRRLGAREIGRFESREFGVEYAAMRLELRDTFNEHANSRVASADPPRSRPDDVSEEALKSLATTAIPQLTLRTLTYDPLPFGGDGVSGVWRATAAGLSESSKVISWSCIVKSFNSERESAESSSEALKSELSGYQSNSFSFAESRLRMPRLLKIVSSSGRRTILLEDVAGPNRRPLQVQDLCDFGYQLGAWHAQMQSEAHAQTRNRWLNRYVRAAEPLVTRIPDYASKTTLLAPLAVEPWASQANAVWANRHLLLRALADAPHAVCHQDLVASNVAVARESAGIIYTMIDWSTFGSAPIGAELAPLLIGNALLLRWRLESSIAATSELIAAYHQGLASNGRTVCTPVIRFGLMASAALRYIAWGGHRIEAAIDPSRQHLAQSVTGHSIDDMVKNYAVIRRQVTAWGLTALQEMDSLSTAKTRRAL
jgi:hypothetical protein